MTRDQILTLGRRDLAEVMARGHAIDERALDDSQYRGISLGLGRLIEALTWKTFMKTFHRDPGSGRLRGWNVRLRQTGIDGPLVPIRSCWHYDIAPLGRAPRPCGPGLLIDYSARSTGTLARMRDPIVAVHPGSVELLLGWSYLHLGRLQLSTPSYFLLVREGPLAEIA